MTDTPRLWGRRADETPKSYAAFLAYFALGAGRSVREAAHQNHIKTISTGEISGVEDTTVRTWLGWSARHKWVSRSLARDEWIARTSDDQIVSNVTACKLALTTRALDYLTANDGADFLRAARALSEFLAHLAALVRSCRVGSPPHRVGRCGPPSRGRAKGSRTMLHRPRSDADPFVRPHGNTTATPQQPGRSPSRERTTVRTWLGWSSRHKWVSRANARDTWLVRVTDEQILANVTKPVSSPSRRGCMTSTKRDRLKHSLRIRVGR